MTPLVCALDKNTVFPKTPFSQPWGWGLWDSGRGVPEQKFNVNRACFPKEKHPNSQKWAKFMNFAFWPFFWFGLPGRLLTKPPVFGKGQKHRFPKTPFTSPWGWGLWDSDNLLGCFAQCLPLGSCEAKIRMVSGYCSGCVSRVLVFAPKGRQQMGETGFCTKICGFLRFPAKICGFLQFSVQICDSQIPWFTERTENQRKSAKICENVRSGSGFFLLLSPL